MMAFRKPFQTPIEVDVLTHKHRFVIATNLKEYISTAELRRSLGHARECSE
jgi:hypothetical protein